MKLDILTKQRIDKWFSEVTPNELLYISQKYLKKDQSLQLIQSCVVGQSEQLSKRPNTSSTIECFNKKDKNQK